MNAQVVKIFRSWRASFSHVYYPMLALTALGCICALFMPVDCPPRANILICLVRVCVLYGMVGFTIGIGWWFSAWSWRMSPLVRFTDDRVLIEHAFGAGVPLPAKFAIDSIRSIAITPDDLSIAGVEHGEPFTVRFGSTDLADFVPQRLANDLARLYPNATWSQSGDEYVAEFGGAPPTAL